MKFLIIAQRSYPQQGPRAFRTTELAEQLARIGHEVIVYSIHGSCKYEDYEKKTGVTMKNIKTVFPIYGNDNKNRFNFIYKILYALFRKWLLFPEIELHYRVNGIIQKEKDVDVLITIAYPHTIHSGAARAKKKNMDVFPKLWIADCGDPFFLNPFLSPPFYFKKYEKKTCCLADYITVPTKESIKGYFPEFWQKIRVIPQGFDFSKTPIAKYNKNSIPTFIFTGNIYPGKRDVHSFMDFLLSWPYPYNFKLFVRKPLENKYVIESKHQIAYIVGRTRKEIIWECSKADFLINVANPISIQTPSKLIDYGISKRPILNISSSFEEIDDFENFYHGNYEHQLHIDNLDDYKIENVVNNFVSIVEQHYSDAN
jgi:hypothetical protein